MKTLIGQLSLQNDYSRFGTFLKDLSDKQSEVITKELLSWQYKISEILWWNNVFCDCRGEGNSETKKKLVLVTSFQHLEQKLSSELNEKCWSGDRHFHFDADFCSSGKNVVTNFSSFQATFTQTITSEQLQILLGSNHSTKQYHTKVF